MYCFAFIPGGIQALVSDPFWSLSGGSLGKFKHLYKDPLGAKPQSLQALCE